MDSGCFLRLWEECAGADGTGVFERLCELYGEEHRYYHGAEAMCGNAAR
jgi:hypothetical protein